MFGLKIEDLQLVKQVKSSVEQNITQIIVRFYLVIMQVPTLKTTIEKP